jgi:4-diphosphocytidyl-2C-methyl-D-erythritol kinase
MVLIPVSSLKKALIVLQEKNYCISQLEVARDTIKTQQQLILNSDTIINNQAQVIVLLKENNENLEKVIKNKDVEISHYKQLYKKEKRNKWMFVGGGSALFILSIIFL